MNEQQHVFIEHGPHRKDNLLAVLRAAEKEIVPLLADVPRIVIKPNFLSARRVAASTHPQTLETVLAWVRDHYAGEIVVAEGSKSVQEYREKFQIDAMLQKYEAHFFNTNSAEDHWLTFEGRDDSGGTYPIRYSQTAAESFRISLTVPKTHANAGFTGGIKNFMGLLHPKDRKLIHGLTTNMSPEKRQLLASPKFEKDTATGEVCMKLYGLYTRLFGSSLFSVEKQAALAENYVVISRNLFRLANTLCPNLTILDAYESMIGEGPWFGGLIPTHTALASLDFLAADVSGAQLLGIDPYQVGYLALLLASQKIPVDHLDLIKKRGTMHSLAPFHRQGIKELARERKQDGTS